MCDYSVLSKNDIEVHSVFICSYRSAFDDQPDDCSRGKLNAIKVCGIVSASFAAFSTQNLCPPPEMPANGFAAVREKNNWLKLFFYFHFLLTGYYFFDCMVCFNESVHYRPDKLHWNSDMWKVQKCKVNFPEVVPKENWCSVGYSDEEQQVSAFKKKKRSM